MKDVIQKRIALYKPQTSEDELNALKEISQEIILYGLSKTDFFRHAAFQGGTCLRIVHGMNRFSEDLDFSAKKPNLQFDLNPYLDKIKEIAELYDYNLEITGKDRIDKNIRTRMLKDNSVLKQLDLRHDHGTGQKIKIKLEIDVNPPTNSKFESNYVDFPVDFAIVTHDLPSLFAGKCHALLHRKYTKGRDWYDYLWYVNQRIEINWDMFKSALEQSNSCPSNLTKEWLGKRLCKKIEGIRWPDTKRDVEKFLKPEDNHILELWSEDFFIKKTENLLRH